MPEGQTSTGFNQSTPALPRTGAGGRRLSRAAADFSGHHLRSWGPDRGAGADQVEAVAVTIPAFGDCAAWVVIDGFGAGHSYFKLPCAGSVDCLKIDRASVIGEDRYLSGHNLSRASAQSVSVRHRPGPPSAEAWRPQGWRGCAARCCWVLWATLIKLDVHGRCFPSLSCWEGGRTSKLGPRLKLKSHPGQSCQPFVWDEHKRLWEPDRCRPPLAREAHAKFVSTELVHTARLGEQQLG